jgi:hypothetical protein
MTETLEQEPTTAPVPPPPPRKHRPNRVYQAAAWVAIVAGVVFIVSAIFFTGFALGRNSDGGFGGHHRGHGEMGSRSAPLMPGMRPDRPMGPSRPDMGPGMRPDAPGSMGPDMRPENPPQPAPPPPTPRP